MNLKEIFADDPEVLAYLYAREIKNLSKTIEKVETVPGPQGEKGERGDAGQRGESVVGPMGPQGEKGDSIRGMRGSKGEKGESIAGPQGEKGDPGNDAVLNLDDVFDSFIERIIKEKPIDISQIRNANSFMFGGKRYKIEELMHGGGSTTTSGKNVTTQYLLTAVQSGSDVTIDLVQLTHFATFDTLITVYRNNAAQTLGVDFTATATTVTIKGADASEIFNITYSYT